MAEFMNPYVALNAEKKVDCEEIARLLRIAIASEFEAIQVYQQIASVSEEPLIKMVLKDIADEETVHVGELLKLMKVTFKEDFLLYEKGFKEVEEMIDELRRDN